PPRNGVSVYVACSRLSTLGGRGTSRVCPRHRTAGSATGENRDADLVRASALVDEDGRDRGRRGFLSEELAVGDVVVFRHLRDLPEELHSFCEVAVRRRIRDVERVVTLRARTEAGDERRVPR